MSAVGYATLSVIPSFANVSKQIEQQIAQPLMKAGKSAGDALAKGVGDGVDSAAKAVEKANYRVLKSKQELEVAESKLTEQKHKAEAANKAVELAALKRAEAESKGVEAVKKAELELEKKRAAAVKAARDLTSAEQGVERAMAESANATKSLEQRQKELAKAQDDAGKKTGSFRERLRALADEARDSGSIFDGVAGKVGALAGAFAGVAGAGALFANGMGVSSEIDKMNRQLGLTGETAKQFGEDVTNVMRSGFSSEAAIGAIGALNSQFGYLGSEGEQSAAQLADNFAAFADTFGVDMAEATQVAGQLIKNGLAPDVETAADLMTAAFQRVPEAMRNELPEIINEYGVNFSALGFSGEEAFGMLVKQAENGKWALDKTGDALKEFTIRGSDMSKTSVEAFDRLGLSAGDMASKIATGGAEGRDALEQTARELLKIEDPAERANTAIALFGTPLEDLSVDQIPAFLEGLSGAGEAMSGFAGASQALSDDIASSFQGRMDRLKGTVSALATEAFMKLWDVVEGKIIPAFQSFGEWVQRNNTWLGPLVAAVGTAAGAWGLWTGAIVAWQTAVKIATGVQAAFNTVMSANPIVRVAMVVAALAAGFTYFFTQTETGRVAWQKFTTALSDGWNWTRDNVFIPMASFVTETLWPAMQSAWEWIKGGFEQLGNAIGFVWNNIIKPVWDAIAAAATWLWQSVLVPAFDGIRAAWQAVADSIRWAWDNIISPVWDALSTGIHWLWDNAINPVVGWIADKWNWLGGVLNNVKDFVVNTVFGGIGSGLDAVKGWFQTAVDSITHIWDGIKAAAARPVRFVVDTVYNNGVRKAWNLVAKFTGLEELGAVSLGDLGAYARGGVLPGYTPGRDIYRLVDPDSGVRVDLSGGEGIMRPEWVRAVGGKAAIDRMNQAAISGGVRGVQRLLGGDAGGFISRYARGGVFYPNGDTAKKEEVSERVIIAQNFVRSQHGKPYQWGGVGNPSWDCSGLWSGIVQVINGGDGFGGRLFNTTSFMANPGKFGFSRGLHGPVTVGVSDDHMAGTLGGINAESASDPKGVQLGGSAWGSDNAYFPNQYTMDAILGEFISGGSGNGGGGFNLSAAVKGLWDGIIDKLPKWHGLGLIGQLPGAMLAKLAESAWNFVKTRVGSFFGASGTAGSAESWREMAMAAMRRQGFNADDPAQVNAMLAQIQSESGGDPSIAQQIVDINGTGESAGVGLLQIIPGTFAAYRDPELPDDRRDPWANMNAALRYYRARYGTDLTTMWGHGHGYAKGGVLPGYTPGRDVHQFFSPTGGFLALSGGEAIMVPEWTRAVGGPAAVARMNAAASGGRTGSVPSSFAAGGVWPGGSGDWVGQFQDAVSELSEAAARLADPSTVEGIAARAGLSQFGEFASAIGFDGTSKIISGVLGAEQELLDAREQHAARMEDLAAKESALESARKALSDAESASYDDEEQRKAAIAKAMEDVTKAEDDLTAARKKSAEALDIRIFDIAPQLHGMLSQAASATSAIPALSGALGGLAAAVGPAGISVGVAVQSVMTGINLFKTVMGVISDLVSGIFDAQAKVYALHAQAMQQQYEWAKMVDDMRAKVVELRVSWVEAQVALRDATWKTRLAQADVVRAQLEGAKTVAEAEEKLAAERKRVARAAARDLDDLSLLYDRYRWTEYQGMVDRLDLAATVTPEILALEAEVNAAKLTALANQRSASLAALQASWEQQKAALNLQQVQSNLAIQTQQLALMQSQFGGFGQAESLQAMNTAKLYEQRAQVQSQIGKSFWRLSYWLTGAGSADLRRIKELDQIIAEREAAGKGAGSPVGSTGAMSFFGYGDSAMNAVKNAGYGAAEQAMFEFQEQQQLQQIELQKQQLEQQIEQNKLFVEYQKQIADLTAEIEALNAGAASAQYTADAYREDSPAVRSALQALAEFEAGRALQYADVAAGRRQVVEITLPEQDVYTREQVDALLGALQKVASIEARVTVLETPSKPGANQVLQDISRRY